jgi:hypothetical protein
MSFKELSLCPGNVTFGKLKDPGFSKSKNTTFAKRRMTFDFSTLGETPYSSRTVMSRKRQERERIMCR